MSATHVLNAATTQVDSAVVSFPHPNQAPAERKCQVAIVGGTATVVLKGRLDPSAPWVTLNSFSATGIFNFTPPADCIVSITAISGATVDAWVL
jgi:hypothetical protein